METHGACEDRKVLSNPSLMQPTVDDDAFPIADVKILAEHEIGEDHAFAACSADERGQPLFSSTHGTCLGPRAKGYVALFVCANGVIRMGVSRKFSMRNQSAQATFLYLR